MDGARKIISLIIIWVILRLEFSLHNFGSPHFHPSCWQRVVWGVSIDFRVSCQLFFITNSSFISLTFTLLLLLSILLCYFSFPFLSCHSYLPSSLSIFTRFLFPFYRLIPLTFALSNSRFFITLYFLHFIHPSLVYFYI